MTAVTAVVLAGGDATRFADGDKLVARVGDDTVLARVVSASRRATARRPVVAAGSRDRADRYRRRLDDVSFATDADGFEGPLAGVLGALDRVDTPRLFVVGGDAALLRPAAARWLLDRFPAAGDAVVVRHPDGTLDPLHAGYRRDAVADARASLPTSAGVRALLDALNEIRTVPLDAAPDDVGLRPSLANVNTRDDLAAVRDRLSR